MPLAILFSRARTGIQAPLVTVEVHITGGLPALSIVGLPETAVKESKDRVRSAILNSRFEFPTRRITINLAPADLPKEGGRFDLAIALGILAASSQIPTASLHEHEFIGELALSGALRPVNGVLPAALHCCGASRALVVCADNCDEAALVPAARIHGAHHLLEVTGHLMGQAPLPLGRGGQPAATCPPPVGDLRDVRGQYQAKRALEVAAAGQHNLLMLGPPGTGKTMLASRLPGILPPMTQAEALETATVHSISHSGFDHRQWGVRPFRSPHHSASGAALVGGGGVPRPGEISLAHNGVLFLDELPEFQQRVLEALREPLESGTIVISRAARQEEFPARFQLIAAMNPCPASGLGPTSDSDCSGEEQRRYLRRLSGPLLDRFDLHIQVPRLPRSELYQSTVETAETTAQVRQRVCNARERQLLRAGKPNSRLSAPEVDRYCALGRKEQGLLEDALERLGLSARAWHRILKVSRTLADLDASDNIRETHLAEAIAYRSLDRLR